MREFLKVAWDFSRKNEVPLKDTLEFIRNHFTDLAKRPELVTIEFKESPAEWEGRMVEQNGNVLFNYKMPPGKFPKSEEWIPISQGSVNSLNFGVSKAEYLKDAYPDAFGTHIMAKTFAEFKEAFLLRVQGAILNYSSSFGRLYMPSNYQTEILTTDFLKKLGAKIHAKNKKFKDTLAVKRFLLVKWQPEKLFELDRFELAARVNAEFYSDLKPDAIWKLAERMKLKNKRSPGPKGFEV